VYVEVAEGELFAQISAAARANGLRVVRQPESGVIASVRERVTECDEQAGGLHVRLWSAEADPEEAAAAFADPLAAVWLGRGPETGALLMELIDRFAPARTALVDRFVPAATVEEFSESSSEGKVSCLRRFRSFATKTETSPFIACGLELALDEMFMNAVFNAPEENGQHFNSTTDRAIPTESPRPFLVSFNADHQRVGVRIRDHYGSLSRSTVLERFRQGYRRGGAKPEDKAGGAGLGLYFILQHADELVFECNPGRFTDVLVCRYRGHGRRHFARATPTVVLSCVGSAQGRSIAAGVRQ
jgi:hypothetical protein